MTPRKETNGSLEIYTQLGRYILGVIAATVLSSIAATKVMDYRIARLEEEAKAARLDIKELNGSMNELAISVAKLAEAIKYQSLGKASSSGSSSPSPTGNVSGRIDASESSKPGNR